MKTFTINDIRSWHPCYDPSRHLPEDWSGTPLDILRYESIPPQDKLWVVCREDLIDSKTLRLFTVWCARQVQYLMTDERSIAALDVAERFANGEATEEELRAAEDAAMAAARAELAAVAAWAASVAARAAAWAAWAASVAAKTELSAREAADAAAREELAVREAQINKLIEMLSE